MSDRLTISVIVGMRTDAHSFRSQVGMGSESDCLFGQLERIWWIKHESEARVIVYELGYKVRLSGGSIALPDPQPKIGEAAVPLLRWGSWVPI